MLLPRRGVVFVCAHNSARSPMAEGLARKRVGAAKFYVASAGVDPSASVHPLAVATLKEEDGIDISHHVPRGLDAIAWDQVDLVVSLAGPDALADAPRGIERLHWPTEDPTATGFDVRRDVWLDRFRDVRDLLDRRLGQLEARGHESFGPPGMR